MIKIQKVFYVKLFTQSVLAIGLLFSGESALADAVNHKSGAKPTVIKMYTSEGIIDITLDSKAEETKRNFLNYVKSGFYDNTIFHRVIDGFMIQGGALLSDMSEKPASFAPIKNEGEKCAANVRGSIAMARTADPHSATSQFFINVVDNNFLNFVSPSLEGWGYCAFGHVTQGMDVVDKIKRVDTTTRDHYENVPVNPVIIQRLEIVQ